MGKLAYPDVQIFDGLNCMSTQHDNAEYEYSGDCGSAKHGAIGLSFMAVPAMAGMSVYYKNGFPRKFYLNLMS